MSQQLEWIRPLANAFWEIVGHLKEEGVTIVYSSHYIEEVEHTADRIPGLASGAFASGYDASRYEKRRG